ncbi:uncharacterized protein BDW70DRAFT_145978 [Aspergillus foveolatus]|uniref:uncharacterized protein n=1 Tax=Aspergillus foveolatus TaxID=210207 RepID=UPI003CCDEF50
MPQPTGELELSDEMRAQKLPQVPKNIKAVFLGTMMAVRSKQEHLNSKSLWPTRHTRLRCAQHSSHRCGWLNFCSHSFRRKKCFEVAYM